MIPPNIGMYRNVSRRGQTGLCLYVDGNASATGSVSVTASGATPGAEDVVTAWRMSLRMKTVSVALVLCLNIGTDPPDIVKTAPCARVECWIDPFSMPSQKAFAGVWGGEAVPTKIAFRFPVLFLINGVSQ